MSNTSVATIKIRFSEQAPTNSGEKLEKAVPELFPNANTITLKKSKNFALSFFLPVDEISFHQTPDSLINKLKQVAPEGATITIRYTDTNEAKLREIFLAPDFTGDHVDFTANKYLTPKFMEDLAAANPHIKEINLNKTRNTEELLHAYLKGYKGTSISVRVKGSDLSTETKRELQKRYSNAAFLDGTPTLDLSNTLLIKKVEDVEAHLHQFAEIREVNLNEVDDLQIADLFYLKDQFPQVTFLASTNTTYNMPLFDMLVVEKLCLHFEKFTLRLNHSTLAHERDIATLTSLYKNAEFESQDRLQFITQDLFLLKFYLHRSLKGKSHNTLSQADLENIAKRCPSTRTIIEKIIESKNSKHSLRAEMQMEIDALTETGAVLPIPEIGEKPEIIIPYSLQQLIKKYGSAASKAAVTHLEQMKKAPTLPQEIPNSTTASLSPESIDCTVSEPTTVSKVAPDYIKKTKNDLIEHLLNVGESSSNNRDHDSMIVDLLPSLLKRLNASPESITPRLLKWLKSENLIQRHMALKLSGNIPLTDRSAITALNNHLAHGPKHEQPFAFTALCNSTQRSEEDTTLLHHWLQTKSNEEWYSYWHSTLLTATEPGSEEAINAAMKLVDEAIVYAEKRLGNTAGAIQPAQALAAIHPKNDAIITRLVNFALNWFVIREHRSCYDKLPESTPELQEIISSIDVIDARNSALISKIVTCPKDRERYYFKVENCCLELLHKVNPIETVLPAVVNNFYGSGITRNIQSKEKFQELFWVYFLKSCLSNKKNARDLVLGSEALKQLLLIIEPSLRKLVGRGVDPYELVTTVRDLDQDPAMFLKNMSVDVLLDLSRHSNLKDEVMIALSQSKPIRKDVREMLLSYIKNKNNPFTTVCLLNEMTVENEEEIILLEGAIQKLLMTVKNEEERILIEGVRLEFLWNLNFNKNRNNAKSDLITAFHLLKSQSGAVSTGLMGDINQPLLEILIKIFNQYEFTTKNLSR